MPEMLFVVVIVIAIALLFDFINGFHDSANAISTVIATNVLTPIQAVILAAFWNFIGAFVFTVAVATAIGKGIVVQDAITIQLIVAALLGAIAWDLITWWLGLPTSSSHALIGGLIGAAIVSSGIKSLIFSGINKVLVFIIIAPLLGFIGAVIFTIMVMWIFRKSMPTKVNGYFRKLQLISASFYSLGHGTNDAQKTMGIIAALLLSAGLIDHFFVPRWVILSAHGAIALGTLFGGWRIVKTMGTRITKPKPVDGFCAETGGSIVLIGTAAAGVPVSTTHVISGSIMGVGTAKRASGVRWGIARRIMFAWIFTIPASAIIAGASYLLIGAVL